MAFRVVWTLYRNVVKSCVLIESTWFLSHILLFMYVAMETASNDEATKHRNFLYKLIFLGKS